MIQRGVRQISGLGNHSNHSLLATLKCIRTHSKITKLIKGESSDEIKWHKDIGYPLFCLDPYAERNFIYKGNKYINKAFLDYDRQQFESKINELYHAETNKIQLKDGYAPFCKHLFVPNFIENVKCSILEIDEQNEKYLKSDYVKRREEELPVLMRWFDTKNYKNELETFQKSATYLDIILYSRQQIIKENKAMNIENNQESQWGIISIKPQMIDYEIPMEPSTMMRNALPLNEGGSGVSLNHAQYEQSVNFWQKHARIQ